MSFHKIYYTYLCSVVCMRRNKILYIFLHINSEYLLWYMRYLSFYTTYALYLIAQSTNIVLKQFIRYTKTRWTLSRDCYVAGEGISYVIDYFISNHCRWRRLRNFESLLFDIFCEKFWTFSLISCVMFVLPEIELNKQKKSFHTISELDSNINKSVTHIFIQNFNVDENIFVFFFSAWMFFFLEIDCFFLINYVNLEKIHT